MLVRNQTKNNGFTLIELLVVIAIIGLLSSIILASLTKSRIKAKDARRYQDLIQIANAFELYLADHGDYPYYSGYTGTSFPPELSQYISGVSANQSPLYGSFGTFGSASTYAKGPVIRVYSDNHKNCVTVHDGYVLWSWLDASNPNNDFDTHYYILMGGDYRIFYNTGGGSCPNY